jgi:hypothetical protein
MVITGAVGRRSLTYPLNHMRAATSHLTDFCSGG